jgi:hypothetical protein
MDLYFSLGVVFSMKLIDSSAGSDLPNKKIDVADAQHGGVAPRHRE